MVQAFHQVSASPSCYQSYFSLNSKKKKLFAFFIFVQIDQLHPVYSCAVSQIDSKIYFRIVSPRHNGLSIPSLSLKQDVIEKALLGELKPSRSMYMKKYRREYKEKRSIYAKRYLKKMKEKMLKNSVEEKCDHFFSTIAITKP